MHESSLARRILGEVLDRAHEAGARRVRAVRGWIAESEALSAGSLAFHFAAHAVGTPADGARLDIRLLHVAACCDACRTSYLPEHHVMLCPTCGSISASLDGPTGVAIEAIDVE